MEVTAYTDCLFTPLMISLDECDAPSTVSFNTQAILNCGMWTVDEFNESCIDKIMCIKITFDGDINDDDFDTDIASVYTISATPPKFLEQKQPLLTKDQNGIMVKSIFNCFSGQIFQLPKELDIVSRLISEGWTYCITVNHRIYPISNSGNLCFECF